MMWYGVHLDALSPLAPWAWILLLWIFTEATYWAHKETFVVVVEIRAASLACVAANHPLYPLDRAGHLSQWNPALLISRLQSH